MKLLIRLCLGAALAALGLWLWFLLFPTPETVIRKRLAKVAELATFSSHESQLARIASVQQFTDLFSPGIEINVATPTQSRQIVSGRDDLSEKMLGLRMALGGLKVQFLDPNITLDAGKTEATVTLTAHARVTGDRDALVQEMKFFLHKINGDWLIIRIETLRTLT